jgi:hypothetical protein
MKDKKVVAQIFQHKKIKEFRTLLLVFQIKFDQISCWLRHFIFSDGISYQFEIKKSPVIGETSFLRRHHLLHLLLQFPDRLPLVLHPSLD